jgi:hypothetical protein
LLSLRVALESIVCDQKCSFLGKTGTNPSSFSIPEPN